MLEKYETHGLNGVFEVLKKTCENVFRKYIKISLKHILKTLKV